MVHQQGSQQQLHCQAKSSALSDRQVVLHLVQVDHHHHSLPQLPHHGSSYAAVVVLKPFVVPKNEQTIEPSSKGSSLTFESRALQFGHDNDHQYKLCIDIGHEKVHHLF